MRDPFKIDGPTCINFSGGRTSAYMLWRVLKANDGFGRGQEGRHIVFANTGKEHPATYDFVRECARRWGVHIAWVEYRPDEPGFADVGPVHYSKNGEPFEALILKRNYLPNPVTRFCTAELKIICVEKYLRATYGLQEWDSMVGIRADEPLRVAKIRKDPSGGRRGVERIMPLAEAGIGLNDVLAFWKTAGFDLALPTVNGKAMHGNCDLCFLKPPAQRLSLIREEPERATWWIKQEATIQSSGAGIADGARFTKDGPSYAQMLAFSQDQAEMFDPNEEPIACFCGD